MTDFFEMDIPEVRVRKYDFEIALAKADPDALKEQRGSIYPNKQLRTRPGIDFPPTRNLLSIFPKQ